MASPYPPVSASASASASTSALPHRSHVAHRSPAVPSQPQGAFLPGTKVQVGSHRVVIEKYLSEGGFAHVYVVRVPQKGGKHETAVLKRVAVPDKEHLTSMRTEVETMKKLKGHRHIVMYMDSHASQLNGGGYEVFLLMEFCSGGGLIDFMNTRLQHRLTEPEILKIFADVAEGVACMHYLKPPLLHRDLKVENVLISTTATGTTMYKLCDFGSTAPPRPAAKTAEEGRLIEEDVQKHTTMQYRSPEMIDVWRKQPIDEKADIWALGVLLYKLCYYTTPFEEVGQMAILNASFKFSSYPSFSSKLKQLISGMLKEDPTERPNIYQVVHQACRMQGKECPITDIYAGRSQSEARRNEVMPPKEVDVSPPPPPAAGLVKEAPKVQVQALPEIAPMRRGRPTVTSQNVPVGAKPSPSPARGDPFMALDSKNFDVRAGAVEELSKKYPSLDEFAIAHDTRGFGTSAASSSKPDLSARVTNALADEVFAVPAQPKIKVDMAKPSSTTQLARSGSAPQATKTSPTKTRTLASMGQEVSQQSPLVHQPTPIRPGEAGQMRPLYKSTGTGPSLPPKPPRPSEQQQLPEQKLPDTSKRPIWRVPDSSHHRSASQPRPSAATEKRAANLQPSLPPTQRPALLDTHRSKSQTTGLQQQQSPSSSSSRPSLEGRRPSQVEFGEAAAAPAGVHRAKSAQARSRPVSGFVSRDLDYLRDQEAVPSRKPSAEARRSFDVRRHGSRHTSPRLRPRRSEDEAAVDEAPIGSDLDYLRSNEEDGGGGIMRRQSRRSSGQLQGLGLGLGHRKRGSLPGIAGARKIFSGGFGEAFKRFEKGGGSGEENAAVDEVGGGGGSAGRLVTPGVERPVLSPVPGSEATLTPPLPASKLEESLSDSRSTLDETEDLPPDVRRELEKSRLLQEERRVQQAAQEYRQRVAANGTGGSLGPTRASTIQKRVQSLLEDGRRSPGLGWKGVEGYGRFTDEGGEVDGEAGKSPSPAVMGSKVLNGSAAESGQGGLPYQRTQQQQQHLSEPASGPTASAPSPSSSPQPAWTPPSHAQPQRAVARPSAPPKPSNMRTAQWPPAQSPSESERHATQPKATGGLAALLAKDLEGVPDYPPAGGAPQPEALQDSYAPPPGPPPGHRDAGRGGGAAAVGMNPGQGAGQGDVEEDFTRRYPSLSGIEMVEAEIGDVGGGGLRGLRGLRVREV